VNLSLRPISLREARRFVADHHRHNVPPRGWLFGVAVEKDDQVVGVGIASLPVARGLQDGFTVEIIRTCTDGTKNANSMLYGALCRAAAALGYQRAITYTLASEPGASLRAAGFQIDEVLGERTPWIRNDIGLFPTDLFGADLHNVGAKIRWVRQLR
jgi:hypothetical protein